MASWLAWPIHFNQSSYCVDNREHVKFQAIWDQNTLKSYKYLSFKTVKEDDTVTVSRNHLFCYCCCCCCFFFCQKNLSFLFPKFVVNFKAVTVFLLLVPRSNSSYSALWSFQQIVFPQDSKRTRTFNASLSWQDVSRSLSGGAATRAPTFSPNPPSSYFCVSFPISRLPSIWEPGSGYRFKTERTANSLSTNRMISGPKWLTRTITPDRRHRLYV